MIQNKKYEKKQFYLELNESLSCLVKIPIHMFKATDLIKVEFELCYSKLKKNKINYYFDHSWLRRD